MTPKQIIPIIPDNSSAKNFFTIIVVILIMYIVYQTIMLIFTSRKVNKLKSLEKKRADANIKHAVNNSIVNASKNYDSQVGDDDRQDDIRTLLRGKR